MPLPAAGRTLTEKMMRDLISPIEVRLRALERRQARIVRSLRAARRDIMTVGQGLWDAWSRSDVGPESQTTPTVVTTFPHVCPALPLALTLHDSYYGDTTLNWDGVSKWVGCKVIFYPGTLICGAASTPIFYTLFGDDTTSAWTFQVAWIGVRDRFGNICPKAGATCNDTPNQIRSTTNNVHCPPASPLWLGSLTGGFQGQIYPNGIFATFSITSS
jgi:hypothetical protein